MTTDTLLPNPRIEIEITFHCNGDHRPIRGETRIGAVTFADRGEPPTAAAGWTTAPVLTAGMTAAAMAPLAEELVRETLWPELNRQLEAARNNPDFDFDAGGETTVCLNAFDVNGRHCFSDEGGFFHLCTLDDLIAGLPDFMPE